MVAGHDHVSLYDFSVIGNWSSRELQKFTIPHVNFNTLILGWIGLYNSARCWADVVFHIGLGHMGNENFQCKKKQNVLVFLSVLMLICNIMSMLSFVREP